MWFMNNLGAYLFCQNLKQNINFLLPFLIKHYSISSFIFKFIKNIYCGHMKLSIKKDK